MKPKPGDARDRIHHRLVAEQRLAREAGDHVRDHAHRRQNHDVHGRVRIEPEQVLPQQRLPAAGRQRRVVGRPTLGNEKPGPQQAIHQLHEAGRREHRQGERLQDGRDEHGPDRHRQAEHRHAGSPHLDDGGHVVDRTHHRRDAHERQAYEPQRLAVPVGQRQRRIRGPAGLGCASFHEKAGPHGDERRPHEPVAQHVQRRKRHVLGADHQRDQIIAERPGQDRNDHEEDHDRGVHREQNGVELGRDLPALAGEQHLADDRHLGPGPRHLPANAQRQQPADQEPDQRREKKLNPDDLVIAGENIRTQKASGVRVGAAVGIVVRVCAGRDGAHSDSPSSTGCESTVAVCSRYFLSSHSSKSSRDSIVSRPFIL